MTIKKDKIARIGLGAMGFVYMIVGILTALAALNLGGRKIGTKGAIAYLAEKPLGKMLLALMALGLFCYVFWRLYQTFFDSRQLGTNSRALFTRAGYFTGALFYGSLGFVATKLFFGVGYDQQQDLLIRVLDSTYGNAIAIVIGLILASKSIFEIYFVISSQFKKNVQSSEIPSKIKGGLLTLGAIGHIARAILFGIMAFLTLRAGFTLRNKSVSTTTEAFQFLNYKFGVLALVLVAIGLLCFGLYMLVKARYIKVDMD